MCPKVTDWTHVPPPTGCSDGQTAGTLNACRQIPQRLEVQAFSKTQSPFYLVSTNLYMLHYNINVLLGLQ